MKNLPTIERLLSMFLVTIVLIVCIANNINHAIIYAGIAIISGLGGYIVMKRKNHP